MTQQATSWAAPRPARWYTEPERASAHGVDVALRRAGQGPTVVFMHGHWLTRRWTPFHDSLASSVDLIAPELPGFGETALPDWLTDRDDMVLLCRDLLNALGLDRVHVAGYGLGGWLAADLAVYYPELVASLSLIAPFGLRVPDHPIADIFAANPAAYPRLYFGPDAGPRDMADLVPGAGTPGEGGPEEFAQRYGEMGTAARLMWSRRYDTKLDIRLPRLDVPTVVIGGENDRVVPAPHLDRWAELLNAQQVRIPDAGHAVVVQQPERVAVAVADHARSAEEEGAT